MTRLSRFERAVVAELGLRGREAARQSAPDDRPRALAQSAHSGHPDLLAHLRRVAYAVPAWLRPVAWLHHSTTDGHATDGDLAAARLSDVEVRALELVVGVDPFPPDHSDPDLVCLIAEAPGVAGNMARVVARAALLDAYRFGHRAGDQLRAMRLLGYPGAKSRVLAEGRP